VVRIEALTSLAVGMLVGVALPACVSAMPARAAGAPTKPLGITEFTMHTTEASPEQRFANEPYMFTQAGGHPVALTSTVELAGEETGEGHTLEPTRDPKNVIIDLPAGLLANPQATPRCPLNHGEHCPVDTQVGVFEIHAPFDGSNAAILGPIINLIPPVGQDAELGLETPLGMFLLSGHLVRTPQGYTLALMASNLPTLGILSIETTLWGVPAAAVHDPLRGLKCIDRESVAQSTCEGEAMASGAEPVAFLTMGSECSSAPQSAVAWADSWEEPQIYVQAQASLPGMASCERLPFSAEIAVHPETPLADRPVGMSVDIKIPQIEYVSALVATPPLRDATVTLPQGVSINPGVGDGLQACDSIGPTGIDIPTGLNASEAPLQPEEVGPGEETGPDGQPQLAPGHCPKQSIVGTAQASTPLLAQPLEGHVYMARPECGGSDPGERACTEEDAFDGKLYRFYVELGANSEEQGDGVLLKLTASVQANPATGQLTVRLDEDPQLPISELSLHLLGGPTALLANPATCGSATTSSVLEPWSAPSTPAADPSSSYNVRDCANPTPLNPTLIAGSVNADAGAFSPFTITVTRGEGEQDLAAIQLHTPPGLSAMLSSVPLCEAALANTGQCPQASRVGSSLVAVGAGPQPLYMPGSIYLTGPYEGAPFGLSIVTDAMTGPLNLGPVVIGARIDIDPQTAAMTISSDPLPQIVLGIPLRIQGMTLDLDRPGFVLNPTNCDPLQIAATVAGSQGASAEVSNPYAVGDCKSLAFKPSLKASTSAHTSYANGASLDMQLTFPRAARGTQANLAQIKLTLPKQLASRLTTLQDACAEVVFQADPSACPSSSIAGTARAQTPILPGELTGPVYLVAHGRHAFPSPLVVLQGEGVRLDLTGSTVLEDSGASSIAFETIPDIPIDSFELSLPQGPHSVLAAATSLCTLSKTASVRHEITRHDHGRTVRRTIRERKRVPANLRMPSELVAQNGAVVDLDTRIEVSGCATSAAKAARRPPISRYRYGI
jgi:hypothetical protein